MNEYNNELYHHGVKGQKWGVRRYQNKDGSLTAAGKKHQRRALEKIRETKEIDKLYEARKKEEFQTKTRGAGPILDSDTHAAKMFIAAYKSRVTSELLEKAYEDGTMQVGRDYITDRSKSVKLTESGKKKEQEIRNKADESVNRSTELIRDKFINDPNRRRTAYEQSVETASRYAGEIRSKIESKKYASEKEKKKAIDREFRKKMREVEDSGDETTADELWQHWMFMGWDE